MDHGLWIFRDDEFDAPLYAEPERDELDDELLWETICEAVLEAFDGDGPRFDVLDHGEFKIGWKLDASTNLSFVARAPIDQPASEVKQYLTELVQRYLDEVDDARFPEPGGVQDVVVDVIPPWEI